MLVQRTFRLPQAHEPQTVNLGALPYSFKDGVTVLTAPAEEMDLHERYLFRNWEVVPEGEAVNQTDDDLPLGNGRELSGNDKLRAALSKLDPTIDTHWIKDGRPAIEAVQGFYGSTDVTRADVEAAAPGFVRGGTIE